MGRKKLNVTYIVVKSQVHPSGSVTMSALRLGSTLYARETAATKHCRRYGVFYDAGNEGHATTFSNRRSAQRAVNRTVAFAKAHGLDTWPKEGDLHVIGVDLGRSFGKDFNLEQ